MRQSRFSDEQIIGMIKEQEAGMPTAEVCRKHGISTASFYKYKAKFGGMEVSDARKLKALEDENAKLKKLLALHCSRQANAERLCRELQRQFQGRMLERDALLIAATSTTTDH